jgi:hypothetical protein
VENEELKALGIAFHMTGLLEQAYSQYRTLLLLPILGSSLGLDLSALPKQPFSFKEVFLKWALQANEARIKSGLEPIFTMKLVMACPLWKLVRAPIITIKLTKDSLLKQVGKTQPIIGKPMGGALNRSNGNNT